MKLLRILCWGSVYVVAWAGAMFYVGLLLFAMAFMALAAIVLGILVPK